MLSCVPELPDKKVNAGYERSDDIHVPNSSYRGLAVNCLRDFLVDEDAGGTWKLIEKPVGSVLTQSNLDGTDNPCLDFANYGCGLYIVQYKVVQPCCQDSTRLRINKRCCNVTGSLVCN